MPEALLPTQKDMSEPTYLALIDMKAPGQSDWLIAIGSYSI